jgi:hypothetical protein
MVDFRNLSAGGTGGHEQQREKNHEKLHESPPSVVLGVRLGIRREEPRWPSPETGFGSPAAAMSCDIKASGAAAISPVAVPTISRAVFRLCPSIT